MSIADKLKILSLIEKRENITTIARKYELNESTIRTIRNNKDCIQKSSVILGQHAKWVKVVRQNLIGKTEEMLLIWMQDLLHKKIPISTAAIRAEALVFHAYLNKKYEKNEKKV